MLNKNLFLKKGMILSFLFFFFFINLVIAQPPFEGALVFDKGLDIGVTAPRTVPTSTNINLTFHVFNSSTGLIMEPGDVSCEGYLTDPYGIEQIKQYAMERDDRFYFTLPNNNATTPGIYQYTFHCNTSYNGGFYVGYFEVTKTGNPEMDEGYSIYEFSKLLLLISLVSLSLIFYSYSDRRGFFLFKFLAGTLMIIAGLYIGSYGLPLIDNQLLEGGITWILLGTGFYFFMENIYTLDWIDKKNKFEGGEY